MTRLHHPRWVILLLFIPFFVQSHVLVQGLYLPKVGVLSLLSLGMATLLFLRKEVSLPKRSFEVAFFTWLVLSIASGTTSITPWLSYLNAGVTFSAAVLFIYLINVERRTIRLLLAGLVVAGLLQFLTLAKGLFWPSWQVYDPEDRWIGTLGNSEFLATFLGCGVFSALHFMRFTQLRWQRLLLIACIALFLAGLLLTRNKGSLFLVSAYLLWWSYSRNWWPWLLIAIGSIGVVTLYPSTLAGRVFLWISGLDIMVSHPWLGIGPGQLPNHYIEAARTIFTNYPATLELFASHTASTRDIHNLLLSFGIEMGIGGFVLAGLFLWAGFMLSRPLYHPLRAGVAFLLIKSLYTVVLSSGTGAILLAIFAAATFPSRWLRHTAVPVMAGSVMVALSMLVLVLNGAWTVSDWHLHKAIKQMIIGDQDAAGYEIYEAVKFAPDYAEAWLTLGEIEYLKKDTCAMEVALDKATFLMRDMDTYKKSAHLYYFSGNYTKAFPIYSRILSAYPQHLTSMARIAEIYQTTGDHASAKKMAMRLLDTVPRIPSSSDLRNIEIARNLSGYHK